MRGQEYHVEYTVSVEGVDGCDLDALKEVVESVAKAVISQFPDATCYVKEGEKEKLG